MRGISFSTFRRMPPPTAGISPHPLYWHAAHEAGYEPDQWDYLQYESHLREYFLNEAHARAALLQGGLLWRLAREVLGNKLDHQVLLGPSAEAHTHGTYIKLSPKESEVWDDCLPEAELNFICGVIPILTGKFNCNHANLAILTIFSKVIMTRCKSPLGGLNSLYLIRVL